MVILTLNNALDIFNWLFGAIPCQRSHRDAILIRDYDVKTGQKLTKLHIYPSIAQQSIT